MTPDEADLIVEVSHAFAEMANLMTPDTTTREVLMAAHNLGQLSVGVYTN